MELIEHRVLLHGEGCHGLRADPEVIATVLMRIKPTIQDVVRMGFLRSSRLAGRPIKELAAAWKILSLGQLAGPDDSTILLFEAPTLGAAAPRIFEQGLLWPEGPSPDDTAFDLMGDIIHDVRRNALDSERFDTPLLRRIASFSRALHSGLDWIGVSGHRLDSHRPPAIDRNLIDMAKNLAAETPASKRVRVQGKLDMIRVSDRALELILKDGNRVRAVWSGEAIIEIGEYLNQTVLIEGSAVFRPSGSLLRVDAEAIAPASADDVFFSVVPTPQAAKLRTNQFLLPQAPTTGFGAILGRWPGDETDTEMLAALEEIG